MASMDASLNLIERFSAAQKQYIAAFSSFDFYAQMVLVCAAILLALGIAHRVRNHVRKNDNQYNYQKISREFAKGALKLLDPLLTVLLLGVSQAIANDFLKHSSLASAATKLALVWLSVRIISLIVQNKVIARLMGYTIFLLALLSVTGFLNTTADFLDSLAFEFGKFRFSVLALLKGAILCIVLMWCASTISRLTEKYLRRVGHLNYNTRELLVKFLSIFYYFIAFVLTLNVVGVDLTALTVFGGALGVGIGFGLQKITANFISGIILLFERSVKQGDLVEIGTEKGWVRQMNVRYSMIETFDGREILFPNEELIATKVTNWTYTNTKARIDVPVGIAYHSDVPLALYLVIEAATEHPRSLSDPKPACFVRKFSDSSIDLLLTFWVGDVTEGLLAPQSEVMISIIDKFRANGVEFPFPQREVKITYTAEK